MDAVTFAVVLVVLLGVAEDCRARAYGAVLFGSSATASYLRKRRAFLLALADRWRSLWPMVTHAA